MKPLPFLVLTGIVISAAPALAQTATWQIQPYCNRLTLTLNQRSQPVSHWTVIGDDDQCGNGLPGSVSGTGQQVNANAFEFNLTIVAPGQKDLHLTATINLTNFSGQWSDSGGLSGTFAFAAATGGSARPPALPQQRVSATCAPDSAIRSIGIDGTVVCETDDVGSVGAGSITSTQLADSSVTGTKVADGAISAAKVLDGAVGTSKLASGAVSTVKIADGAVTTTKVLDGAIGSTKLTDGAVGTAKLADGAVTVAKVVDGAIGSTKLADGAVVTAKLADAGITAAKLAAGAFAGSGTATSIARSDHTHAAAGTGNTSVGASAFPNAGPNPNGPALGGSTAVGAESLFSATNFSFENTAVGWRSLRASTSGNLSTAVGALALMNQTTGYSNTAVGAYSLRALTTGTTNTGVGYTTLENLVSGDWNIALGYLSGVGLLNGTNNVYINAGAGATNESNTLRVGQPMPTNLPPITRAFIGGIRGVTTGVNNAVSVVIDSAGQLGTVSSSRRTKDDIADLGPVSAKILDLRPVSFTYKKPFSDGTRPVQYGLIAEEVEQVMPELVAYNQSGEVETVKYHVLPTLLLAEVQRLERERATQAAEIAGLKATVERLERLLTTSVAQQK